MENPLDATAFTPEQFRDYLDCFNRGDFPGFTKYYAEDVWFQGRGRDLRGRQAIEDYYRIVQSRLRESIVVRRAYFGGDGLAAELHTTLVVEKAWPDFFGGPLQPGDVRQSVNFVMYSATAGRFTHIRSARFEQVR